MTCLGCMEDSRTTVLCEELSLTGMQCGQTPSLEKECACVYL